MTLQSLRDNAELLRQQMTAGALVRSVVERYGDEILERQRLQLLAGKASSGEDIRPYYSEDLKPEGHFYSVESAGRYAAWKQDLSYPYTVNRNPDAPNLYITGKFHGELTVQFGGDALTVLGATPFAAGIVAKYGLGTFGLCAEQWEEFWDNGHAGELIDLIKEYFQ